MKKTSDLKFYNSKRSPQQEYDQENRDPNTLHKCNPPSTIKRVLTSGDTHMWSSSNKYYRLFMIPVPENTATQLPRRMWRLHALTWGPRKYLKFPTPNNCRLQISWKHFCPKRMYSTPSSSWMSSKTSTGSKTHKYSPYLRLSEEVNSNKSDHKL